MSMNRFTVIAILVLLTFATNLHAQDPAAIRPVSVSSVTGSGAADGRVRMIAHGEAPQIRIGIYSANGELVSDSGLRNGNLIDWKQTEALQGMPDGAYLVVVTVKDFKGNLNQRLAALSLQAGQLQLQSQKRSEVITAQAQSVQSRQGTKASLNDRDDTISILREGKERAVVVNANDGTDGEASSTAGSQTFRTGNVFASQE